jgi:hypothetical protein
MGVQADIRPAPRFSSPASDSTASTFLARRQPECGSPTRKMWVSTAMVGHALKAMLSTTFAVLRPTPGSASSAARSCGTSPPWRGDAAGATEFATTFFALVR